MLTGMEEDAAPIQAREEHLRMLVALVRAYQDRVRPHVPTSGLDERDIAFEAGLLTPMETELTVYATRMRGRVLSLLRDMESWGWVAMKQMPPQGAYHVFLEGDGIAVAQEHLRPWWSKLMDRFRSPD
jgi:hypothetical protein